MRITLLLIVLACLNGSFAQSIRGNLNSGTRGALGYGNVDIYRGDELVASLLTDRYGNFNVALDTGSYRCVVSYDGYITESRTVRVRTDEQEDFAIASDPSKPERKERALLAPPSATTSAGDMAFDRAVRPTAPIRIGAGHTLARHRVASTGVVTAGEVNDFAKWSLWQDISTETLSAYRDTWEIAHQERYTVDVQSPTGLPLADVQVQLLNKDGTSLYSARTDNTGKAELWGRSDLNAPATNNTLRIEVSYKGTRGRIARAKPFGQGVNKLVLDVACGPSDKVDVAFVVDATGSMQDELDFLQAELNDIIFRSKRISDKLDFRFANVFYRDQGPAEEYTTRIMDFSRVLSASVNFISDQKADGGGDEPEAVHVALDSAINHLNWSEDARTRIIFLVLDAGPHRNHGVKQNLKALVRQAAAKGIRIVPLAASGIDKSTEYLLRSLALGTNGTYTFLTRHSGVGSGHLEPTTDQYTVESLNDLLVRILKSYTYMPDCAQEIPDLALNYPDSLVAPPDSLPASYPTLAADSTGGPAHAVRWSYYPNPTNGLITIHSSVDIPALHITDLSGKVLQLLHNVRANESVQADLSAYATGIYLIRYPHGARWLSGKVVLQR